MERLPCREDEDSDEEEEGRTREDKAYAPHGTHGRPLVPHFSQVPVGSPLATILLLWVTRQMVPSKEPAR